MLLYDDPGKVSAKQVTTETHIAPKLGGYFSGSSSEVDIISSYFVPGHELVSYLGELVAKGIRVRILTN